MLSRHIIQNLSWLANLMQVTIPKYDVFKETMSYNITPGFRAT